MNVVSLMFMYLAFLWCLVPVPLKFGCHTPVHVVLFPDYLYFLVKFMEKLRMINCMHDYV